MTADPARSRRGLRHRLSIGLRGFLAFVAIVAVGLAWKADHVRAMRRAVARIERQGGRVFYDYERNDDGHLVDTEPAAPAWLRRLVGDDYFREVVEAHFRRGRLDDETLRAVGDCDHLETATFLGPTQGLTDAGLAELARARRLRFLSIEGTAISDAGLASLARLDRLETVILTDMNIGDPGMAHLGRLRGLKWLDVSGSRLTDAGLGHLAGLDRLEHLLVRRTRVTDAGLAAIARLKHLRELCYQGTEITRAAVLDTWPGGSVPTAGEVFLDPAEDGGD